MTLNRNKLSALPALLRSFCYNHEAWLVGSAATYLLDLSETLPRDWDVLVPFWAWGVACRSIPTGTPSNSFGGFKMTSDGFQIDVWAGDIGWFLAQIPVIPGYAVHPLSLTSLNAIRHVPSKH